GAAFWRRPQGAPETVARAGTRTDAERDADSANPTACAHRRARSLHHRVSAGRPVGGAHLRGAARSSDDPRGAAARTLSWRPGVLRGATDRRLGGREGFS